MSVVKPGCCNGKTTRFKVENIFQPLKLTLGLLWDPKEFVFSENVEERPSERTAKQNDPFRQENGIHHVHSAHRAQCSVLCIKRTALENRKFSV